MVCSGDQMIGTAADIATLNRCSSVTGNVRFYGTGLASVLSLPALRTVDGSFEVSTTELTSVSLPALTRVGGLRFNSPQLQSVSAPTLTTVDRIFELWINPKLTTLDLPALASVGSLSLNGNALLANVSFPSLASVTSYINIASHDALVSASFPVLTQVGMAFSVSTNASLTALEFPLLTRVGGSFTISNNTKLPTCRAQAIVSHLSGFTTTAKISGNDDAGTCP